MYKIIGADQKEYGPISGEQIRQWITEGRLNAQTKVQAENGAEWQPLAEIPQFVECFRPPQSLPSNTTGVPPRTPCAKTSAMAVTSLVLGILGLFTCGITALAGLILGIVAMTRVKKSNGALSGYGIALTGLIISAVFLLFIPIEAAMLLPALAKAKQKAQTINCVNNMKQLALAMQLYSNDNDGHFPPAAKWCDALKTQVGSEKIFQCPAGEPGEHCHYAFNVQLDSIEGKVSPKTVLFFETGGGWNVNGGPDLMLHAPRHGRVFVVALADGSVLQLTAAQLADLRWNPETQTQ